jgi:hypothetical protein
LPLVKQTLAVAEDARVEAARKARTALRERKTRRTMLLPPRERVTGQARAYYLL